MDIGKLAIKISEKYKKNSAEVMQQLIKTESNIYRREQYKNKLGLNDCSYFYLSASHLINKYKK